jgi:hypothetical protein
MIRLDCPVKPGNDRHRMSVATSEKNNTTFGRTFFNHETHETHERHEKAFCQSVSFVNFVCFVVPV